MDALKSFKIANEIFLLVFLNIYNMSFAGDFAILLHFTREYTILWFWATKEINNYKFIKDISSVFAEFLHIKFKI